MDKLHVLNINIDKIHTTGLGEERIKNNLNLDDSIDVVEWCKNKIQSKNSVVYRKGKNFYVMIEEYKFVINVSSYTLITAYKR